MRVNSRMRALLSDEAFTNDRPSLPPDTRDIVDAGWTVGPNGALLLASRWRQGMPAIPAAGLGCGEYDVNDVYISLDDLGRENPDFVFRAAARGLYFTEMMLEKGLVLPGSETLLAMVAVFVDVDDEAFALQGARVRFFTRRGDFPEWFDDLEAFKLEAIAMLDRSDVPGRHFADR
jgi:hypothetical protein